MRRRDRNSLYRAKHFYSAITITREVLAGFYSLPVAVSDEAPQAKVLVMPEARA